MSSEEVSTTVATESVKSDDTADPLTQVATSPPPIASTNQQEGGKEVLEVSATSDTVENVSEVTPPTSQTAAVTASAKAREETEDAKASSPEAAAIAPPSPSPPSVDPLPAPAAFNLVGTYGAAGDDGMRAAEYEALSPEARTAENTRRAIWPVPLGASAVAAAMAAAKRRPTLTQLTKPPDSMASVASTHGVTSSLRRRTSSFASSPDAATTEKELPTNLRTLMGEGSWIKALELTTNYLVSLGFGGDKSTATSSTAGAGKGEDLSSSATAPAAATAAVTATTTNQKNNEDEAVHQQQKQKQPSTAPPASSSTASSATSSPPGETTLPVFTPAIMQIWFARAVILVQLGLIDAAAAELDSFGSFDRPDLRRSKDDDTPAPTAAAASVSALTTTASLVPFSLRLLHALLPARAGQPQAALDRIFPLLHTVRAVSSGGLDDADESTRELWCARQCRLLQAASNCFLLLRDYSLSAAMLEDVLTLQPRDYFTASALGRLALYLGDTRAANRWFLRAAADCGEGAGQHPCMLANNGFLAISKNKYETGAKIFAKALEQCKALGLSGASAINNHVVCTLYKGGLTQALVTLEQHVPQLPVHRDTIFNLATLFELKSNAAPQKKKNLIPFVLEHAQDGFDVKALKI